MKRDPIRTLLQTARVPSSQGAMLRTTELAVARAAQRSASPSQRTGSARLRAGRRSGGHGWPALPRLSPAWRAGILASVGLLTALSFTPPGRAATAWVGGIVGIGEVGGPPSIESRLGDTTPPPNQVVLATGAVAGNHYEVSTFDDPARGTCFALLFPAIPPPDGTARCASDGQFQNGLNGFCIAANDGCGPSIYDPSDDTWTTPALGIVSPNVAKVRVAYEVQGTQRVVEPEIASLPRSAKQGNESAAPQAVFFFLPQYVARADSAVVTTYDSQGNEIGHASDPTLLNLARCKVGLDCPNN